LAGVGWVATCGNNYRLCRAAWSLYLV
jgi:hypothetical protein